MLKHNYCRFHLTSWRPCWCTLNKRILIISSVWNTNMTAMSIVFCLLGMFENQEILIFCFSLSVFTKCKTKFVPWLSVIAKRAVFLKMSIPQEMINPRIRGVESPTVMNYSQSSSHFEAVPVQRLDKKHEIYAF